MNPYESEALLNQYLLFHYGTPEDILGNTEIGVTDSSRELAAFPVRSVAETFDFAGAPNDRALDLGCAVGRSAFELTQYAGEVVGIDYSLPFIEAANRLKDGETVPYQRLEEATMFTDLEAVPPANANTEHLSFIQGDAMKLPLDLGEFDFVHVANLLCRVPEPKKLLDRLPTLVKPGGQAVLTTPGTWLEEYTAREHWPESSTFDLASERLDRHFDLIGKKNLMFLLRETVRKFQFTTAETTVWRRRRN